MKDSKTPNRSNLALGLHFHRSQKNGALTATCVACEDKISGVEVGNSHRKRSGSTAMELVVFGSQRIPRILQMLEHTTGFEDYLLLQKIVLPDVIYLIVSVNFGEYL